jgi:alpha-galactosidase
VWEAVYFRHEFDTLAALADTAASIGAERYVLDDGWFTGRRSDRAGLGDWQVYQAAWPGGLHRLTGYVRDLGLAFGLWIEPEMVNPDSELYRAHPDWILPTGQRVPPPQRHQLVLDLTRPEVSGYLFERISALLSEYPVSYVKWDCNRDLIDAGSGPRAGAPAAHDQALAVYGLLDRLRERFPAVEWESCAAGGGRIDLAMLERTERVWTSDMTDALARQPIQRWTGQLVPPEYLGAHVVRAVLAPDRPVHAPADAVRHGPVRAPGHRMGHHPGRPGRTSRPRHLDRAVPGTPRAHPHRPHDPARHPRRHRMDVRRHRRRPVSGAHELRAAR